MTDLSSSPPSRSPIGISTGCFYQTPIADVLPLFADHGYDQLEICSFPRHLDLHQPGDVERAAGEIERNELSALSLHAPFADHIDISAWDESERLAAVEELGNACRSAKILGATYVVLHPGPEKERNLGPHEWYPRMQLAADSLNRIADECEDLGVTLLLENMLPHLMFGHVSDMLFLLGAIDSLHVGTCLDTGHAYLSGDIAKVAHKLSCHLRMIHANDNNGKWDDHLPPGEGQIGWENLLQRLHAEGFDGKFVLELNGNGTPDKIFAGAARGREFLESLWRRVCEDSESLP